MTANKTTAQGALMPDCLAPMAPKTKSFRGAYLLRRKPQGKAGQFHHPSFESAEMEARRLLGLHPESTFVIIQEVARVKLVPADAQEKPL